MACEDGRVLFEKIEGMEIKYSSKFGGINTYLVALRDIKFPKIDKDLKELQRDYNEKIALNEKKLAEVRHMALNSVEASHQLKEAFKENTQENKDDNKEFKKNINKTLTRFYVGLVLALGAKTIADFFIFTR